MKHRFLTMAFCTLLLLAAGCKNNKGEEIESLANLNGNVPAPEWVAPEDYDYSSSMIAVIRVDLAAKYPKAAHGFVVDEQDLLAAFIGDECCGIATPQDSLFYLYVTLPEDQTENDSMVSLKYWSAGFKNIFLAADAFPFTNDAALGSYKEPCVPNFVVAK